jgi:hypothetical protein
MTAPDETGRRTKVAPRTPTTGHTERALAGAPSQGRGSKALLLYPGNVVVFVEAAA